MKIKEALVKGSKILSENNIEEAMLNAKILLSYILNLNMAEIIIHFDSNIEENMEKAFLYGIEKIARRLSCAIYN